MNAKNISILNRDTIVSHKIEIVCLEIVCLLTRVR